ncbi:DUF1772 domain-containing protein [Kribbella sp. NBC_01245]|uniref:anthrone oxygenase family protein n=1 Tax=Kribbella sp. NBC_01245 TaxID=2903578 RepID=UPI002E2B40F4|nr:anthrone oxygenase family protein [Kribbella sp. NBC_01245]
MIGKISQLATIISIAGVALNAGLFFAFDTTVMKALRDQPAPQGIATMNSINVHILNPVFLLVFTGSAISCVAVLVTAPFDGLGGTAWRVAGAIVFLIGTSVVTGAVNVPMNNALAAVDAASAEGAAYWQTYLSRWVPWNHVRTVSSLAAVILMALGFRR